MIKVALTIRSENNYCFFFPSVQRNLSRSVHSWQEGEGGRGMSYSSNLHESVSVNY